MPWSAEELRERVGQRLGDAATAIRVELGDTLVEVPGARIVEVMRGLRDDEALDFQMLVDLTAVDRSALARGGDAPRFEIVYQLFSLEKRHRLRVKAAVASEPPEIDSVVSVWPAANWMEREVWDLYGIRIAGHPDLRRILLCEEFEGHPLRKDFPKRGLQPSSAAGEGD
ncbi:MAG: NADH-quinone oxidoreductase subunit C [Deltaproteobacteria bacterium]|nr:NADH-quinone oxidoreductase subunit C [Deltaproteobacteria bacterium]